MTLDILHTIADSVYSNTHIKIREAIANSVDNGSQKVFLYFDTDNKCLSLFDDGSGISQDRFDEILKNLGHSLYKGDPSKLSYYGLGLVSLLQMGKEVVIYTKTNDKLLKVTFDTKKIFDPENVAKPISFLDKCIDYENASINDRNDESPLKKSDIISAFGVFPKSYTEIIIKDVNPQDVSVICDNNFNYELKKLLPLKAEYGHPFLSKIKKPLIRKQIEKIIANKEYNYLIDMYVGYTNETFIPLFKHFPVFKEELEFDENQVLYGSKDGFCYYFLFATEDLEERDKDINETGFWVRNRNFLVKAGDFLEYPWQPKEFRIQKPLKAWIFGEIFHGSLNECIDLSRNEFKRDSDKFKLFSDEVLSIIKDLNAKLRHAYNYNKSVKDDILDPLKQIGETQGPLQKTEDSLDKMGIKYDGKEAEDIFNTLKDEHKADLKNEDFRIDHFIKDQKGIIVIKDDSDAYLYIDPKLKESDFLCTIDKEKRPVIRISPELFSTRQTNFLGRNFEVVLTARGEKYEGIRFDVDNGKLYINLQNEDLKEYSFSFMHVYIAVEIAHALAKGNADVMKSHILKLIGAKASQITKEVIEPLAKLISSRSK